MLVHLFLATCMAFQQGVVSERIYHGPIIQIQRRSFRYEIPNQYIQRPEVIQGPILDEISKRLDDRISPLVDRTFKVESILSGVGNNLRDVLEEMKAARQDRMAILDSILESRIERQQILESIKELKIDRVKILESLSELVKERQTILQLMKDIRAERQSILDSFAEFRKDREEIKEGLATVGKLGGNIREILDEARANRAEARAAMLENLKLARENLAQWTPLKDFIERINSAIKSLIMTFVWVGVLLVVGLILLAIFGAIIAKMYAKIKKIVPIPGV